MGAHGKRITEVGHRVQDDAARQCLDNLAATHPKPGLQRAHPLGGEERIDDSAKRRVLWRIQTIGYLTMRGDGRRERPGVGGGGDDVAMPEQCDPAR
jgi:hypothetical protein